MTATHVLGVDGGSSKTEAVVASPAGGVLAYVRAGSAEFHYDDAEAGVASIVRAADTAMARAGVTAEDLGAAVFSLAGADWPEDIAFLQRTLEARFDAERTFVVNDALGALYSGAPDGVGVAVASGTDLGMAARGPMGQTWTLGFWVLADPALRPVARTLQAVYGEALGVGPRTSITPLILEQFEQLDVESLLHHLTRRDAPHPPSDAALAMRSLLDAATIGDEVARRIVTDYARTTASIVAIATERVGIGGSFPLVLTGGAMEHDPDVLAFEITKHVRAKHPAARAVHPGLPPVAGAVVMAFQADGRAADVVALADMAARLNEQPVRLPEDH
jgi:N-acetylglucosamine kinase-like BadF-type ATPase